MFLSRPQYEFLVPIRLGEPGCQHWRIVEMSLHAPWYLLTVDRPGSSDAHSPTAQTLFIAWDTDLADVIKAVESARILGLLAIVPGWASPTGQWTSRQINEVWLDTSETGTSVTLLDIDGNVFDAGMFIERPKAGPHGVLLLRLKGNPRTLSPQSAGSGTSGP